MVLEQLDVDMQINSCSHRLTPFTKINSKSITDLNVNHKTIKHLEDNTWKNLDDFGYVDDFLDSTPKAWSVKKRNDKVNFIKIKILCSTKDNEKTNHTLKGNICKRYT